MKWLGRLTKLKELVLEIPNVGSPPVEWSCLCRLQSLYINCFDLRSLHRLPSSLDKLGLLHVRSPIDWQCLSSLSNVSTLKLWHCLLKEIKFDCIEHLHCLHLYDCGFLERLSNLSRLRELRLLDIKGCPHLVDIEGMGELKCLQSLEVDGCSSIRRLPDLSGLKKLEKLALWSCCSLESIPDVDEEVPCHLRIIGCHYFHDFIGPYSERDRAIKNEDSLNDSDGGSDRSDAGGSSSSSSGNIGDSGSGNIGDSGSGNISDSDSDNDDNGSSDSASNNEGDGRTGQQWRWPYRTTIAMEVVTGVTTAVATILATAAATMMAMAVATVLATMMAMAVPTAIATWQRIIL